MALSAPGLGANLDVNGLVRQLMTAESAPLAKLAAKEASYQSRLSAYGSMKGALASLQSAMTGLASIERFRALHAVIGDTATATVSTTSDAQAANYSVEVQTLAQAQKLKSTAFPSTADSVGSGSLTIQFGTYVSGSFTLNSDKAARTITIPPDGASLAAVRDAINSANAGVSAGIVNDGSGYRLVLASSDPGVANALRISVSDADGNNTDTSGLSRLAYDASSGGNANLTQTVAAQNASLLLDGISISKSSNTISDAIQGVTLNLTKTGGPTTLSIARESSATQAAAATFVQAWNSALKTLRDLGAYDAKSRTGAILQGDSTLLSAQNRLRAIINQPLTPAIGGLERLSDIGIRFLADGSLSLDSAKLAAVLADKNRDVATLFAAVGKASDSLVSFASGAGDAAAGVHDLSVTRLATRGHAIGSAAANTTIVAGANDTLTLAVDGASASVSLAEGVYTAASLAAELQSRINGVAALANAGISVAVTQSGGVLSIASTRYGSASSVAISGGSAVSDLLGTPTGAAGVDVAGSIGGVGAVGAGQILTGRGLTVGITGGATGARGTISYARGIADQAARLLGDLLVGNGPVDSRSQGINSSIKDIGTQRIAMTARLAQIEKRYRAQFTALDTMVSRMSTTSSFLTQQLAALPGTGSE